MFQIFVAIVFIILSLPLYSQTDIFISGEIRHDVIEFDKEESQFFREKLSIKIDNKKEINAAYIYSEKDSYNLFSYNINLQNKTGSSKLIAGNYYINYGSGILMGKKQMFNQDIFKQSINVSFQKNISLCNNGNPLYAFHGITYNSSKNIKNWNILFNSFASIRNRYTHSNKNDINSTKNSMSTISKNFKQTNHHTEAVFIRDTGIMMQLVHKYFVIQLYSFETDIFSNNHRNVLWESDKMSDSYEGISFYNGNGIFFMYADTFINIFFEGTAPVIMYSNNKTEHYSIEYGYITGLRFTSKRGGIHFIKKETSNNYYAPYASYNSHAEDSYESYIYYTLTDIIKTDATLYVSNKKNADYYNYIPVSQREQCGIKIDIKKKLRLSTSIAHAVTYEADDINEKIQSRFKNNLYFNKHEIYLGTTIQKKIYGGLSYAINGGLKLHLLSIINFENSYTYFKISENNSIYTWSSPYYNSLTSGFYIDKTSHLIMSRLNFTYKKIIISGRIQYLFTPHEIIKKRFEGLCKAHF